MGWRGEGGGKVERKGEGLGRRKRRERRREREMRKRGEDNKKLTKTMELGGKENEGRGDGGGKKWG